MKNMFKKPKRNFRGRRKSQDDDEDTENRVIPKTKIENTAEEESGEKNKPDENLDTKGPVISFSIDDEADTEEFKVKKSSQSRRMARKHKREKKDKKKQLLETQCEEETEETSYAPAPRTPSPIMEHEEEEIDDGREHTFSTRYRDVLSSGTIPDATFIHNAKKKRQLAREQGDYIPVEKEEPDDKCGRLVREDENDASEDEERIKFHAEKDFELERREISNTIMAAEHENEETESWEDQQIRKAVNVAPLKRRPVINISDDENAASPLRNFKTRENTLGNRPTFKNTENLKEISVQAIRLKVAQRLESLTSVHSGHVQERNSLCERLKDVRLSMDETSEISPKLEKDFEFYQEMKAYVQDLIECLQEKFPKIVHLEENYLKLYAQKATKLSKRRQLDVNDESLEYGPTGKQHTEEENINRSTEREARRKRRRQNRIRLNVIDHFEGTSTDEEMISGEYSKFETDKSHISTESKRLFEDVDDEYCKIRIISKRFENWSSEQPTSYNEAYIALCLPKLFSPFVRLALVDWNPLESNKLLSEMKWIHELAIYNMKASLSDDEIKLIPTIIEKTVVPKVTTYIDQVWDPLSSNQTNRLQKLVRYLFHTFPTLNKSNKNSQELMKAIVKKIETVISKDIYLPLYPKNLLTKTSPTSQFFNRQFWSCIKCYSLIYGWFNIISDEIIMHLAFDGLLNKYILLGMSCLPVDNTFFVRCEKIVTPIPKEWFDDLKEKKTLPQLDMFCKYLVRIAEGCNVSANVSEQSAKDAREWIKQIAQVLLVVGANDYAISLGNKYSFRI